MITQVNEISDDRDAMKNYFPHLSADEFYSVTSHLVGHVIELLKLEPSEITALNADKARRFLKKLALIVNDRWLSDGDKESADQLLAN